MVFRRAVTIAALLVGLAGLGLAAEPAKVAPAPDEYPMHTIKILRTTNKAQVHRYVPKVYTVNNVNPYALKRWIRRIAQIEEGGFYFFGKPGPDGKVTSGKVMLTVPSYMVPDIDALMKTIDRAGLTSSSGDSFFYYRPKHRHVEDTAFTDLIEAVQGGGDFKLDEEANAFMVYTAGSRLEAVKAWLPEFDLPPKQVAMEVIVYEVNVDNESRIGLDYMQWKNGPGRHAFSIQAYEEYGKVWSQDDMNPLFNSGVPGGTFGLPGRSYEASGRNGVYFLDVPSAFFDFLVVKNKARVMTAAKMVARNKTAASLFAGDTILYYEAQNGPAANAGVRPAGVAIDQFGDEATVPDNRSVVDSTRSRILGSRAGVLLEVTPTIGTEEIEVQVRSEVVSHTGFDQFGTPQLVSRDAETEAHVKSGQEIVLGGYSRTVMVERSDKMPFLGSLPVLGSLFGQEGTTTERRQIVVVLSTTVVEDFAAMEYDPTKVNAARIKAKALREQDTEVPDSEVGFDQWMLDMER